MNRNVVSSVVAPPNERPKPTPASGLGGDEWFRFASTAQTPLPALLSDSSGRAAQRGGLGRLTYELASEVRTFLARLRGQQIIGRLRANDPFRVDGIPRARLAYAPVRGRLFEAKSPHTEAHKVSEQV